MFGAPRGGASPAFSYTVTLTVVTSVTHAIFVEHRQPFGATKS